jgi:hypothetical protein
MHAAIYDAVNGIVRLVRKSPTLAEETRRRGQI